jgi:hypothetical protein
MKKHTYLNKISVLLAFTITLLFYNCDVLNDNNDTPQLPEATQSGKNTFGFKVNGEIVNVTNTSKQTAIFQQGQLQFGTGGIYILLGDPLEVYTNYNISDSVIARYFVNENPNLGCHYNFDDTYQGFIRFSKIDRINYIISGTFEFSTNNDDCEDIKITEGVFDMKYIP